MSRKKLHLSFIRSNESDFNRSAPIANQGGDKWGTAVSA